MDVGALELWLLIQAALEAVLVLLMIVFLVKLKRIGRQRADVELPPEIGRAMEKFLKESEQFTNAFNDNLNRKKELSLSLLLKLERRINEMNRLLDLADKKLSKAEKRPQDDSAGEKANPAAPENRALVLKLAGRGLSVEEIARKARLNRGEVELILDLEKQFRM